MLSCSLRQILTQSSECSRNRDSSDQATFFQSSIVQFWWICVNCILRVLFLSDRSSTRCGLLLLEPICFRVRCCVFRDGILQILVVTSCYLSYCLLSIISNQSVHSPLTSDINKAFSSTQLPLTGYFLFFRPFSVNLEMVVCENPSRSAVCEILRSVRLTPTTIPRSKPIKSSFFPVLMLGLNFSKSSSPHLDV